MARILHVEDDEAWRRLVRDTLLRDHHVDSADSFQRAVDLLGSNPGYDVALIDLNLGPSNDDRQGGEILDLILARYPAIRRVVVTGFPPPGAVRRNVFERYDVEDIILKKDTDIPDLRRVIEAAIGDHSGRLPQMLRLQRSALKQRFRDWERAEALRLRAELQSAEEHLEDAAKVSAPARRAAQLAIDENRERERSFQSLCSTLRGLIDGVNDDTDFDRALEAFEAAEEQQGLG